MVLISSASLSGEAEGEELFPMATVIIISKIKIKPAAGAFGFRVCCSLLAIRYIIIALTSTSTGK